MMVAVAKAIHNTRLNKKKVEEEVNEENEENEEK